MTIDYLIVGSGLAGICFAETAINDGKQIIVINDNSQNSSKVAAGLYNPVILKRFTEVWQSLEQLELLNSFYSNLEIKLQIKLDHKIPLLRKFYSIEEQNNWFAASDKPGLNNYLSSKLITKKWEYIDSPNGYGEVNNTGYVDTKLLVKHYVDYLKSLNLFSEESFNHSDISFSDGKISYKGIRVKHIVFAEGFGMLLNPFFNYLPLDGAKGELLLIKAPNLNLEVIIKTSIFIIPLGDDVYKVGATYNWDDKTNIPTPKGKEELIKELKELIHCDFDVLEHLAGVRPTVKDRKPMIGTHPLHSNLHILNGLGTRGVMLAPSMSKMLFDHIENQIPLDTNVDIKRFMKLFSS